MIAQDPDTRRVYKNVATMGIMKLTAPRFFEMLMREFDPEQAQELYTVTREYISTMTDHTSQALDRDALSVIEERGARLFGCTPEEYSLFTSTLVGLAMSDMKSAVLKIAQGNNAPAITERLNALSDAVSMYMQNACKE